MAQSPPAIRLFCLGKVDMAHTVAFDEARFRILITGEFQSKQNVIMPIEDRQDGLVGHGIAFTDVVVSCSISEDGAKAMQEWCSLHGTRKRVKAMPTTTGRIAGATNLTGSNEMD